VDLRRDTHTGQLLQDTHTGPLLLPDDTELTATGKRVEFVTARDGKIVVDNLYFDDLAVATQLGLVPHPFLQ
jgi:hypothetical protein